MRRNKTKRVSSEHTSDPGWVEFQDKSTKEKERMSLKKVQIPNNVSMQRSILLRLCQGFILTFFILHYHNKLCNV